jgi:membrane fusion protein, macrolide-specific efflux system
MARPTIGNRDKPASLHRERSETLKRHPFIPVFSVVILTAALLLVGCSASSNSASKAEPTPTPLPTTAALAKPTYSVQRGEVIGTVQLTGRIAPVNQQPFFFPIDGRVHSTYIRQGDTVEAGTLIADLEGAADLQRQLDLIKIGLQRSQINAEIAQLNLDLFIAQTPQGSTGYDKRLAIEKLKLDLANLDVQEASLGTQELQDSLDKTRLVSPMAGQVTALQIGEGSQAHAYDPVGTVADTTQLEVSASTTDNNILDKLDIGMTATLVPASGLGKPVTGAVRRLPLLGTGAQLTEQDKTIRISLDTSPADAGYRMGDLVDVTVIVVNKANVLWVPPQTIRTFGGRKFVVVQDGNMQRRVDVKVGVIGEDRVEIVTGLTEGQVVVSP